MVWLTVMDISLLVQLATELSYEFVVVVDCWFISESVDTSDFTTILLNTFAVFGPSRTGRRCGSVPRCFRYNSIPWTDTKSSPALRGH